VLRNGSTLRLAVAAAATVGILLLSGCTTVLFPNVESTSKPTGESVPAAVAPYYHQSLAWKNCGKNKQCAMATAPMDWDHPSRATDITLALTRASATGSRLGSLFVNPGGPGASGYDLVHDDLDFAVSKALQKSYDVGRPVDPGHLLRRQGPRSVHLRGRQEPGEQPGMGHRGD
jgi:hypothetical protein